MSTELCSVRPWVSRSLKSLRRSTYASRPVPRESRSPRLLTTCYTQRQLKASKGVQLSGSSWQFGSLGTLVKKQEQDGVDKALTTFGEAGELLGGVVGLCKKGNRTTNGLPFGSPEDNQDNLLLLASEGYRVYGVFDGHGSDGGVVSYVAAVLMHNALSRVLLEDAQSFDSQYDRIFKQVFEEVHEGLVEVAGLEEYAFDIDDSGTTATVVVHDTTTNSFYHANVGDSRAVLAYSPAAQPTAGGAKKGKGFFNFGREKKGGDKTNKYGMTCIQLSTDHRPDAKEEKSRISKKGGRVLVNILEDGTTIARLAAQGTRNPGLAVSRIFGDVMWTDIGISHEPAVGVVRLPPVPAEEDPNWMLFLGSDGFWEFVSADKATSIVQAGLRGEEFGEDLRTEAEIKAEMNSRPKPRGIFGRRSKTQNTDNQISGENTPLGQSIVQMYRAARLGWRNCGEQRDDVTILVAVG